LCGAVIRRRFGSIRQLPSGRWQAAYSAPNGRRVLAPHTFAKRAVAEAWLGDPREIDRGLWKPGATGVARTRFDAYSSRWLANRDLKPRTAEQYQQILTTHLLPAFGEMQLAAIAPADVRDWYSDLLPGKPTMRARTYALLRAILATAITDELIDSSPCRIRGAGQTQRVHKIRPASVAELAELTAAMPDRLKLAVPLASWCALRFGEMIELRRGDVDLSDEVIRVRRVAVKLTGATGGHVIGEPKSGAGVRDVAIPPHLLRVVYIRIGHGRVRPPDGPTCAGTICGIPVRCWPRRLAPRSPTDGPPRAFHPGRGDAMPTHREGQGSRDRGAVEQAGRLVIDCAIAHYIAVIESCW